MSPSYNSPAQPSNDTSLSAILAASSQHLKGHSQSMDGRPQEYQQSDLSSPYTHYPDNSSQGHHSADSASTAQYQQDAKFAPDSARSANYPEYIVQRQYQEGAQRYQQQQPNGQTGHAAMAQASSPSLPMPDGIQSNGSQSHASNSDSNLPIDPSIAASSPTYPPHQQQQQQQQQQQYSPYPPQQHEMQQYGGQPGAPIYAQQRPEWGGHYGPPMYAHAPVSGAGGAPGMVAQVARPPPGGHPLSTVYSFVPIPGAQQHKRPRRRYEEIERMYKCGWNGCEKAYGTLNHLNAHVTMQSHGTKRTPEEFKEIRKEWKAKKKEEDNARKQEDERARAEGGRVAQDGTPTQGATQYPPAHMMPPNMGGGPQLPPIGYAPAGGQAPAQYAGGQDGGQQYAQAGQMYGGGAYPQSPYTQGGQVYQQHPEQQQAQPYQQ